MHAESTGVHNESAALTMAEALHRVLFDQPYHGFFIGDPSGRLVELNSRLCEILNCAREELAGVPLQDLVEGEGARIKLSSLTSSPREGYFSLRCSLLRRSGQPIPVDIMATVMAGGNVVGIIHDGTGSHRALNESGDLTALVTGSMPFGMEIVNADGTILFMNQNFRSLTGGHGIGQKCWEVYKSDKKQCSLCPLRLPPAIGKTEMIEVSGIFGDRIFQIHHTGIMYRGQPALLEIFQDVTDRRRNEKQVLELNRTLSQAEQMAHLGAWRIEISNQDDVNANALHWSDEVYRIFGYDVGEIEPTNAFFFECVHPEDRQRVREAVAHAIAEKRPYTIEHRVVRPDKTERIVLEYADITFDPRGRPVEMRGAVQDITENRKMEQALLESAERIRATIDNAAVGIVEVDADDRFVAVNDRICQLLDYRREELLGMTVHDLTYSEDRPHSDQLYAQLHNGALDTFTYEKRYVRRDGSPLWAHVTVSTLRDQRGHSHRHIDTIEDIQERKQAREKLQESEERYRSLFENMLGGFAYCRMLFEGGLPQDYVYLEVNSAFEHLTGLRDVVGRKVSEVIPGIRESNPEVFEIFGRVVLTGRPERFETYVDPLGIWFSISVHRPAQECFVAVFDAITERKRAEQELLRSLREKELLLREVHHRVKNNMQVISSMLRLQSRAVDDAVMKSMLAESQNRIRSMSLVHELLYRTENLQHIAPRDYVEGLVKNLYRSYGGQRSQVRLDLRVDSALSWSLDTAIASGLIINELVSNALKYAFPAGTQGTIRIHLSRTPGEQCRLLVGDTGVGLPNDLDIARSKTLGLQLVQALVKKLHGKMEVRREPGTEYSVTFNEPQYRSRL